MFSIFHSICVLEFSILGPAPKNVTLPLIITLLTLLSPPVMHAFLLSEGFQQLCEIFTRVSFRNWVDGYGIRGDS